MSLLDGLRFIRCMVGPSVVMGLTHCFLPNGTLPAVCCLPEQQAAGLLWMAMAKRRITKAQMTIICERIADGISLTRICNEDSELPSWRTVLRHVQEDEAAYTSYRIARSLQCEVMRDQIIDLVEAPLPSDPKLAMAEVQRRRLEADHKDKHIRQMQPLGLRDKAEDSKQASGTITLSWGNADVQASG